VLWHIVKSEGFEDNPLNPDWAPGRTERDRVIQLYSTDQPEAHDISAAFRELSDSYGDRVLIGEIFLPNDRHARWYGTPERPQVHLPFNFQLIENAWDAGVLAQLIRAYEASLPDFGWPNWVLGSHDAPRIAARIGEAQARVAAMLLLTLRGTPTLYQGDELGIGEVPIPPERVRDPQDLRQPVLGIGRDRSRTPMPWDASPHAGFSDVDPWLPLNPDWQTRNVTAQSGDPESMLSLYRRLLALRRQHAALAVGRMRAVGAQDEILSYERSLNGERLLVALNMGGERRPLVYPPGTRPGALLVSTLGKTTASTMLAGNEGVVLQLEQV
jgi:oligo-1,6-glucosidase/alpha-glucosidase